MVGNGFLSGLSDAQTLEREPAVDYSRSPVQEPDFLTSAFMGAETQTETRDFAQALGGAANQTPIEPTYGTENFAHALEQSEAPTNIASALTEQPVFGLAEQASAKDALALAEVQAQIATAKAELQAKILQAQAENKYAVQEETKILLAQETGNEGIYYLNFLRQLTISVERFIKSMQLILTNSAKTSGGWAITKKYHNSQRDELKLHAQVAG